MTALSDVNDVDNEIYSCLDLDKPRSFFLFAGAGSGKTRSLVEVLKRFRSNNIDRLRVNGQQVAIITYTNAACDEIKRRLEFDPAFSVSTIHSFAWELIKPYTHDIKVLLRDRLQIEIYELELAQSKGRPGTKAAEDRPRQIASKRKRLESLSGIRKFTYSPNGENSGRDSLNHAEVIAFAAELLSKHSLLQTILTRKFPILLVDESQDTKKELVEALFAVQQICKAQFSLGLFGDIMQRIYPDGKEDLGLAPLPHDWLTPKKIYNYRCPRRVVRLINKIRESVDQNLQKPIKEIDGIVRLFIADTNQQIDKAVFETIVCQKMAVFANDSLWKDSKENKTLTLEHHMAAQRGGFSNFFNALYGENKLKTGLLDGTLSGITFFAEKVLPLLNSLEANNQFLISRILNKHSPLMSKEQFEYSQQPKTLLKNVKEAVDAFYFLWANESNPTLLTVLKEIHRSGLFEIPDGLATIAARQGKDFEPAEDDVDKVIDAWDKALSSSFREFKEYVNYISEKSSFGTHQGIKGLEFKRVMVILDDGESRGNFFSYEKLLGAKDLVNADDTSIDRTRRLFYVTCSRAEESLAIVAYTKDPNKVKESVLRQGWFTEEEIIISSTGTEVKA